MIDEHLSALAATALAARDSMAPALEAASAAVAAAVGAGNKVLAFGNGGSATQAQHFAAELVVRYKEDRPGLPSVALTCDGAILTARRPALHLAVARAATRPRRPRSGA